MLKTLQIQNYALIHELEMEPSTRLNMITGETGAGKSIMLGAVGLLMGNRADTKVLLEEASKCLVEGVFEISNYKTLKKWFEKNDIEYDSETIIRREISPSGKSRAFINDQPVTLDVLRSLGPRLIDIHSQHETLLLGTNQFQLRLIDLFAETTAELKTYQQVYSIYTSQKKAYEALKEKASSIAKDHDYNSFLLEELTEARISEFDQEEIETTVTALENADAIKANLNEALSYLDRSEINALDMINQSMNVVGKVSNYSQSLDKLRERIESCLIELRDITKDVESEDDQIEHNPELLEELKGRLSLLYRLQQKHQVNSVEELLAIESNLQDSVNQSSNLDEELAKRESELEDLLQKMISAGTSLSDKRQGVFKGLQTEIQELLKEVGITEASIDVRRNEVAPSPMGLDQVEILFSANKGIPPQEIKHVASGGEFSRLMFCLKYVLAQKTNLPTVVFDEIDSGISGEVALKMVKMMKRMSKRHQIISISHLPQFAAQGDAHYFVYKDNSETRSISKIKSLEGEDRILAIAKMIGGDSPSETALSSARELMTN